MKLQMKTLPLHRGTHYHNILELPPAQYCEGTTIELALKSAASVFSKAFMGS